MGSRLNLHPVGLSEEGRRILSVAMNILDISGCRVCYSEQIKSQNTVALIDVDSEEGRDFYENSSEVHFKVVITGDNLSYRADGLIKKPLRVHALRNLLADIYERILHQNPRMEKTISDPSAQTSGSGTLPNASLFYVLVNAVSTSSFYRISCVDSPYPLLIHGPSRRFYSHLNQQDLENACRLAGEQLQISQLDEFEFMKQAQGAASQRIEKALWLADAYGALGYAPLHMGEHSEFRLNDRPRFDLRHIKPEYLTLAAIAVRRSHTLGSLARMTRIPLTTVFDFYYAAKVCGVVEHTSPRSELEPMQAKVVPSLVSRVAQKLGLKFF